MRTRRENTSAAVMSQRHEPDDSLDYFPTLPWATRALCEFLAGLGDISTMSCWEPACGEGDMVKPPAEYFAHVWQSDVHDYHAGRAIWTPENAAYPQQHDFLMPYLPAGLAAQALFRADGVVDWVITNPPFKAGGQFVRRALDVASVGVAMLVRAQFAEGATRYRDLYKPRRPEWVLQFSERVSLVKGRLDPTASRPQSYVWIVWCKTAAFRSPMPQAAPYAAYGWIPPGTRKRLERAGDYERSFDTTAAPSTQSLPRGAHGEERSFDTTAAPSTQDDREEW